MAQTYKISGSNLLGYDDSYRMVYQCPTSTTSMVNSIYLGNSGLGDTSSTVKVSDDSQATDFLLVSSVLVPEQSSLQPLSAPLVLESNDSLNVKDVSGFLDVVVNVLEIT
jgi:hypothetical protein